VLSGAPSLSLTLASGDDLLSSTRAVGKALLPSTGEETRRDRLALLVAGGAAHIVISLAWGLVLSATLPRRRTVAAGAVAGLGIAAVDLGVLGRRLPSIRALEPGPQVLDHLAYGLVVGVVLASRRRRAARGRARGAAGSRS
jgi:hypothetical protein